MYVNPSGEEELPIGKFTKMCVFAFLLFDLCHVRASLPDLRQIKKPARNESNRRKFPICALLPWLGCSYAPGASAYNNYIQAL